MEQIIDQIKAEDFKHILKNPFLVIIINKYYN
jgi:hypothetical protein